MRDETGDRLPPRPGQFRAEVNGTGFRAGPVNVLRGITGDGQLLFRAVEGTSSFDRDGPARGAKLLDRHPVDTFPRPAAGRSDEARVHDPVAPTAVTDLRSAGPLHAARGLPDAGVSNRIIGTIRAQPGSAADRMAPRTWPAAIEAAQADTRRFARWPAALHPPKRGPPAGCQADVTPQGRAPAGRWRKGQGRSPPA